MTKRSALLRQEGILRPFVIEDHSGNGHHGMEPDANPVTIGVGSGVEFGVAGPFAGGDHNFAALCGAGQIAQTNYAGGSGVAALDLGNSPLTVAGWFNFTTGFTSSQMNALYTRSGGFNNGVLCGVRGGPTTRDMAAIQSGLFYQQIAGTTMNCGTWYHCAWEGTPGASWRAFINGTLAGSISCQAMGLGQAYASICGGFGGICGKVAGLGFYPSALGDTRIAAHAAANASHAAYKTEALADSPRALWMLNELQF